MLPDILLAAAACALLGAAASALLALLAVLVSGPATHPPDPYRHVCQWCRAHTYELVRCAHGAEDAPRAGDDAAPPDLAPGAPLATAVRCPREVCYDCAHPVPPAGDVGARPHRPPAFLCPEHARRPFGALVPYRPRAGDPDAAEADAPGHN